MSIEDKLGNLKMKVVVLNDLAPIWDYFMDEFSENDEFLKMGATLAETEEIHPVVPLVAKAAALAVFSIGEVPNEDNVGHFIPIHLPEYQFIHGATMVHGRMLTYFYFEDLEVGMTAFNVTGDEVTMSRITRRGERRDPHR
jgi:hypothetical protein